MPGAEKRRPWYQDILEDQEDPVQTIIDRVLETPQAAEVIERVKAILDRAGNAIDPKPRVPAQRRRIPPSPLPLARTVLHFGPTETLSAEKITKRRRALAAIFHPDKGGSTEAMAQLNRAADLLFASIK